MIMLLQDYLKCFLINKSLKNKKNTIDDCCMVSSKTFILKIKNYFKFQAFSGFFSEFFKIPGVY